MSLDLYIISKTPVSHLGTGVFIRQNGANVELSVDEVKKAYPDSEVEVREYEDNEVWHGNITHNMGKMAKQVSVSVYTLYQLLWRPEETDLVPDGHPTQRYLDCLNIALEKLKAGKDKLLVYNPSNGWGNYDLLLQFASEYLNRLMFLHPLSEYTIEASR